MPRATSRVSVQLHHLRREPPGAQAAPGNGAASQAMPVPGPARAGFAAPGMAAKLCAMAGMLAGLQVAITPWFLQAASALAGGRLDRDAATRLDRESACNGTRRSAPTSRPWAAVRWPTAENMYLSPAGDRNVGAEHGAR